MRPWSARSLDWESGRLARSMDGPCAAHATDGTSVVPVSPPPASKMADFPLVPPRWRRWERLVAEKSRNGPAVCTKRACHLPPMGLPLVPCGPAVCTKWQAHFGVFRLRVGGKSAKGPGPHRRNPENLQKPEPVAKCLAVWTTVERRLPRFAAAKWGEASRRAAAKGLSPQGHVNPRARASLYMAAVDSRLRGSVPTASTSATKAN